MNALTDIYFYNAMGLAAELRNGAVSEVRAVKHLIASIILGGLTFDVPVSIDFQAEASGFGYTIGYLTGFIIIGVISYYGVWLTYQANRKGDGKDYFLRLSVLTLPVGVQLVVLFLGVGLLLVFLAMGLSSQLGVSGVYIVEASFYLSIILFTAMFFLRMKKYIAIAAGVDE